MDLIEFWQDSSRDNKLLRMNDTDFSGWDFAPGRPSEVDIVFCKRRVEIVLLSADTEVPPRLSGRKDISAPPSDQAMQLSSASTDQKVSFPTVEPWL